MNLMKFFNIINIFELQLFDNDKKALLKLFEICTEMCFVSVKEILQPHFR